MTAGLPEAERIARLRLARTDRIGPVTFLELLRRELRDLGQQVVGECGVEFGIEGLQLLLG